MRWLYHVLYAEAWRDEDPYAPASFSREGFVHASYRDDARESARLYFRADAPLVVLQIDPRRLDAKVDVVETPRGPMPHIVGAIPRDAVRAVLSLDDLADAPDPIIA